MSGPPRLPAAYRLVVRDSVDSTNDEARALAQAGASDGTIVWAHRQQAGRGRLGRSWASPPGNLFMSLVMRPAIPPARAPELSFVAAVALAESVAAAVPAESPVTLVWPNDLMLAGRKAAGILLEAATTPAGALDFVVLGIGVNVSSHPSDVRRPATNLADVGATITASGLLEALAGRLEAWIACWRAEGFAPVRAAWLARAAGVGGPIDVRLSNDLISGSFADLDQDGAMIIETADGSRRRVTAGDIVATAALQA
jgi:BirA family biotin operon repressor/biotin-[acetyl-CoA-carboxylase] ligase